MRLTIFSQSERCVSCSQKNPTAVIAKGNAGQIKLPLAPVNYTPPGMIRKSLERDYDITPKALFHVMFGEKSGVFQTLYAQRRSQRMCSSVFLGFFLKKAVRLAGANAAAVGVAIHQGQWKELEKGKARRQFAYRVESIDMFGKPVPIRTHCSSC